MITLIIYLMVLEPEEYKENEKCEKKKFSTDEFLHGVKSHSDNIHSISKDSEIEI